MKPTIVVPLDGSENAEQSLPYARALAKRAGASMLLISVIDIPIEFGAWSIASAGMYGVEVERWQLESETYLSKVAEQQAEIQTSTIVRLGSPAAEILEVVTGIEQPVIVTTSHGRTGASRIFLGSVASKLVHDAPCPILIVRIQEHPAATVPSFDRIVVPLDGSQFSEAGLQTAINVFGETLSLHLVRVVEMPMIPASGMADGGLAMNYALMDDYLAATRDAAIEYLKALTERLTAEGHTVTSVVRDGLVATEIHAVADREEADAIAMATHGRGGLGRIFLGSVAERVLAESAQPLLLTRP